MHRHGPLLSRDECACDGSELSCLCIKCQMLGINVGSNGKEHVLTFHILCPYLPLLFLQLHEVYSLYLNVIIMWFLASSIHYSTCIATILHCYSSIVQSTWMKGDSIWLIQSHRTKPWSSRSCHLAVKIAIYYINIQYNKLFFQCLHILLG
jgi:hypothetical protein